MYPGETWIESSVTINLNSHSHVIFTMNFNVIEYLSYIMQACLIMTAYEIGG
jgi:hypothetical protein